MSAYSTDAETQAVILYVKPGANGNCTSWEDACELQTALFNAVSGDQIWVAAGTYKPSSSNRSATFQLISGVAIYGGFPAAGGEMADRNWETNITNLSGDIGVPEVNTDNSYHVVVGNGVNSTTVLDGFTIRAGYAQGISKPDYYGGGMYNYAGSPTLTNVTFSINWARFGGGMYNENNSSPTLTNVTFNGNTAETWGGGMYNQNNSSPTLTNVSFNGNLANNQGGGLFNNGGCSPTLTNVAFIGNSSAGSGGGMYNVSNSSILTNVNFSDNLSGIDGGGMYNYNSNPTLTNVTFSSNSAYYGGGLFNTNNSSPTLTNVTISENTAVISGGGIYNASTRSPTLKNTIFWDNSPYQIYNGYLCTPLITYSNIQGGYTGTGNIDADPLLGALANNGGFTKTHALDAGSPAIDAADTNSCPTFDQRNYPRPIDGDGDGTASCDMGSYEFDTVIIQIYLPLILKN